MELIVTLARMTYTSITSLMKLPIHRLLEWAKVVKIVVDRENPDGR